MKNLLTLAVLPAALPAVESLSLTNVWRYEQSGADLGTNWRAASSTLLHKA